MSNMNVIALLIIAGLALKSVVAQESRNNITKIERFLYDRCRIYSTEASAYDEVKKHYTQFSDYLGYTASLLPDGKKQFCNDEKPQLIGLMRQLAKDIQPCFPRDEKYLPKFLYESFTHFLTFACQERNIENFFSTQGSECRASLKSQQAGQETGNCFKKLFARFNDVIKKDDLCMDLKFTKTCFGEAIAKHCPNFAGYESLNKKFFKAIREPCDSATTLGVSSVILMMVAFITTKAFS